MTKKATSSSSLYSQTLLLIGVGILLLLLAASSLSYFKTISLIHDGQRQSNAELAEGLAHSLTDGIVSRDYGALESQIKLILLNKHLQSVLVADVGGKVLAHLERIGPEGRVFENFKEKIVKLPTEKSEFFTDTASDSDIIWQKIEAGTPVGWLRLEISDAKIDSILVRLKSETILIASLAAVVIIGMIVGFLLRIYPKLYRHEKRIEQENREFEFDAMHDALTQLPNRKLMLDRLQQAIFDAERKNKMLLVTFLDLDGFKGVNDRYGHDIGDQLLLEVRNRLLACFRRSDTVSRLGGDEFVILLPDVADWSLCKSLLESLPEQLSKPYSVKGHFINEIGASIGVAIYPRDGATPEILIAHADEAMYAAKRAGKGCLRSFSEMDIMPAVVSEI